jgi:hypothetical protein
MANLENRHTLSWLQFSGKEDDYVYWSEKFESYIHTKKLRPVLVGDRNGTEAEKYDIWAHLIQVLDKRSVMLLRTQCKGDGPAAWKALNAHFYSTETSRVMTLLERFTSLSLKPDEEMVDYLIRADELSSALEQAGEKVSEKLVTSVVLKGLPGSYEYFKTVHDFSKDKSTFEDVKKALRNFDASKAVKKADATKSANRENFSPLSAGGGIGLQLSPGLPKRNPLTESVFGVIKPGISRASAGF